MKKVQHFVAVTLIVFSVTYLISIPLKENQYSHTADEWYYLYFAKTISQKGIGGFGELMDWYKNDPNAFIHPKPSRIGYVYLTGMWLKIFGQSFTSLGLFSLVSFLIFLFISFYFCKKHFGLDIALYLTILLSSSPLLLGMSRRALMDSTVNLFESLSVWLFLHFLVYKKIRHYILFIIALTLAILIKESALILWVFFIIISFIYRYVYRHELKSSYILGIALWPILSVGILYFFILGGMDNIAYLIKTSYKIHLTTPKPNSYDQLFEAGPWYRYIIDFMLLSPWTVLLAIGYFFHVLIQGKSQWNIVYFFMYFVVTFILFNLPAKNIRYVIHMEMVMCLFAVLLLLEMSERIREGMKERFIVYVVTFIFTMNILSFLSIFDYFRLLDPISFHLLRINSIIPWF